MVLSNSFRDAIFLARLSLTLDRFSVRTRISFCSLFFSSSSCWICRFSSSLLLQRSSTPKASGKTNTEVGTRTGAKVQEGDDLWVVPPYTSTARKEASLRGQWLSWGQVSLISNIQSLRKPLRIITNVKAQKQGEDKAQAAPRSGLVESYQEDDLKAALEVLLEYDLHSVLEEWFTEVLQMDLQRNIALSSGMG
ncbi:unnamed protein product [Ranitomeya imitator]|uniref:Uncharacterized protein n=1 Tax=Ranitomeya imitator TaxID=111125 RepID=A0ABN9LYN5_9NEOB|nr:unnamed protein product [Ranitomeya imitator]